MLVGYVCIWYFRALFVKFPNHTVKTEEIAADSDDLTTTTNT